MKSLKEMSRYVADAKGTGIFISIFPLPSSLGEDISKNKHFGDNPIFNPSVTTF